MLLKKLSVFVGALLISCITLAQQEMNLKKTDQVFDAFLQCDKQFFKKLAENKISFNHYVDVTTSDNVTYISVESIKNGEENKVTFKKVYPYHGLTVSGYRNLNISTATSGKFYYWGFILDNSVMKSNLILIVGKIILILSIMLFPKLVVLKNHYF